MEKCVAGFYWIAKVPILRTLSCYQPCLNIWHVLTDNNEKRFKIIKNWHLSHFFRGFWLIKCGTLLTIFKIIAGSINSFSTLKLWPQIRSSYSSVRWLPVEGDNPINLIVPYCSEHEFRWKWKPSGLLLFPSLVSHNKPIRLNVAGKRTDESQIISPHLS